MEFNNEGRASDIQDRRGQSGGGGGGRRAGLSLGGLVVVGIIALLLRKNPLEVINAVQQGQQSTERQGPSRAGSGGGSTGPRNDAERQAEVLVRRATTDIQDFWQTALPQMTGGRASYPRTQLVLFADETRSACGAAEAATGPFFCPADRLVYIDLAFYAELSQRFRAPGDFAQAYVIAHEFGHYVQFVLGIEPAVRRAQRANRANENALSVQLELQADCLAGVWGASAAQRGLLRAGDVEEGMNAAAAIGDDRIARMAGRRVSPERFTHGSSAQRVEWFRRGMSAANITVCDPFGNGTLRP
jgi:predicted metalloprotease